MPFRMHINATYFLYFSTEIRMCVRSIFYYTRFSEQKIVQEIVFLFFFFFYFYRCLYNKQNIILPPVDTKFIQLRVDTNFIFQAVLNPFCYHWLSLQSEWLSALRFIHSLSLSHWEWGIKRKQPTTWRNHITRTI